MRAWWTTFEDEWSASERGANPRRIVVDARRARGLDFTARWRMPPAFRFATPETLRMLPDGSWTFEVADCLGVRVADRFRPEPSRDGTIVRIERESTFPAIGPRLFAGLLSPMLRRKYVREWSRAAARCAAEAATATSDSDRERTRG
ncbi:MAG: hypothetical protein ACYDCK_06870 [Thermoplasmatota archaeon]